MIYRCILSIISIVALVFIISCDDEPEKASEGKAEFAFSDRNVIGGRKLSDAKAVLVTIADKNGVKIYDRKKLSLYTFNGEYLSEPIALKTGNYTLQEYLVVDDTDNVLLATPKEGSALAPLVVDPLPLDIVITKDKTTKVSPQVIKVEGNSGLDFGYSTFTFDNVETFQFLVGVHAYSTTSQNFELTTANVKITSAGKVQADRALAAETNTVTVLDVNTDYLVTISKPGYNVYTRTFSNTELKSFSTTPLVVTLINEGLNTGLVAYYPFSGSASDASGNSLNGTVSGATLTSDRHGIANSAYNFDGNDYISVADNSLLDFSADQDFSISLWVSVSASQTLDGGINDILRKWSGDHQGYPFAIAFGNEAAASNQKTIIAVRYDGQSCADGPIGFSNQITYGTFHHIVFTKSGSMLKLYINNALHVSWTDTTVEGSFCSTTNNSHMTIGTRGQLARFFTGKIDDIRIYSRALSASEIAVLNAE